MDLGEQPLDATDAASGSCSTNYGYIVDRVSRRNVSICQDQLIEQHSDPSQMINFYTSHSNHLRIVTNRNTDRKFLIRLRGNVANKVIKVIAITAIRQFEDHTHFVSFPFADLYIWKKTVRQLIA